MHESFIRRCLTLAEDGRGFVGINPMVGAVLVRDGTIIAEGFHEAFGTSHAERQLLEKYDQKFRTSDVLVVNLEPCCHTDKKTPPCAQFIVEKGIKRVVCGMLDPNPKVAGEGIQFLRSMGVEVIGPVLPEECARLNRGFVSLMMQRRPWITLHEARTVDGRHANPDGSPLKITSKEQDQWAHQFLRARHDAILVGIGTILADDPQLNVRFIDHPPQVYRIILDPHFRIPLEAKVVNGELARGTIVVRQETKDFKETNETKEKMEILQKRGVRVIQISHNHNQHLKNKGAGFPALRSFSEGGLPAAPSASFNWHLLWRSLTTPIGDFHGITSILVEGGPRTWETFRDARMADEEIVLVGEM